MAEQGKAEPAFPGGAASTSNAVSSQCRFGHDSAETCIGFRIIAGTQTNSVPWHQSHEALPGQSPDCPHRARPERHCVGRHIGRAPHFAGPPPRGTPTVRARCRRCSTTSASFHRGHGAVRSDRPASGKAELERRWRSHHDHGPSTQAPLPSATGTGACHGHSAGIHLRLRGKPRQCFIAVDESCRIRTFRTQAVVAGDDGDSQFIGPPPAQLVVHHGGARHIAATVDLQRRAAGVDGIARVVHADGDA